MNITDFDEMRHCSLNKKDHSMFCKTRASHHTWIKYCCCNKDKTFVTTLWALICLYIPSLPSFTDISVKVHDCPPCVQLNECLLLISMWSLILVETLFFTVDWPEWEADVGHCHPCKPWKSHTRVSRVFNNIQTKREGFPGQTELIGNPYHTKLW